MNKTWDMKRYIEARLHEQPIGDHRVIESKNGRIFFRLSNVMNWSDFL